MNTHTSANANFIRWFDEITIDDVALVAVQVDEVSHGAKCFAMFRTKDPPLAAQRALQQLNRPISITLRVLRQRQVIQTDQCFRMLLS